MLTDTAIKAAKPKEKPYKLGDSLGLFLAIQPTGAKWWRLKYRHAGKEKLLSLGVYPEVSLKKARERRDDARKKLSNGIDPSAERQAERQSATTASANTFEAIGREWHTTFSPTWVDTTAFRVLSSLERDAFPFIGAMSFPRNFVCQG
jgi:hypothetical protein